MKVILFLVICILSSNSFALIGSHTPFGMMPTAYTIENFTEGGRDLHDTALGSRFSQFILVNDRLELATTWSERSQAGYKPSYKDIEYLNRTEMHLIRVLKTLNSNYNFLYQHYKKNLTKIKSPSYSDLEKLDKLLTAKVQFRLDSSEILERFQKKILGPSREVIKSNLSQKLNSIRYEILWNSKEVEELKEIARQVELSIYLLIDIGEEISNGIKVYPNEELVIECNGREKYYRLYQDIKENVFNLYSIDQFGNREKEPVSFAKDGLVHDTSEKIQLRKIFIPKNSAKVQSVSVLSIDKISGMGSLSGTNIHIHSDITFNSCH